ncbi:hypothetical protein UA08_02612 [Talaromyces atroroseus]|uniref:Uncharacterized protein n=1 Tax=Talaromyces atroroseus TaxID=1441469 RepID=A0A225B8W9_TALAT|nr:hypothetical protein UA08_02612 [Talaromyces atroroseus]OKL62397.1 hypothetical protein UA08_02612 [Talaromyces atroroseus]
MTDSITRLHISPLSPALLDSILVPSIRPLATDISFHTIPTFPENNYGFVSLPSMEADKLKKKLNGSILKGKKLKVEAARADPSKKKARVDDDDASEKVPSTKLKKTSKRKAEDSVLDGYELPADRKVKRGWTEPASAKKYKKQTKAEKEARIAKPQSKSKYTEKAECLFKIKTPPNKTPDAASKKNAKSKKPKAPNEVVVHEFSQTISHPSFLKSTMGEKPVTAGFEEGKGWVDENGNVQEVIDSQKTRTADYHPGKRDGAKERVAVKQRKKSPSPVAVFESGKEDQDSDWTSSSGPTDSESSDSDSDSDSDSGSEASSSSDASSISSHEEKDSTLETQVDKLVTKKETVKSDAKPEAEAEDSSSGDGEDNDSSGDSSEADSKAHSPAPQATEVTTETKDVHPLEALFKRAGPDEKLSLDTGNTFSFFAGDDDDIEDEEEVPPESLGPLTPYTNRDRQVRGVRSGAPTPDTAVFPRHKFLSSAQSDADEDEDEDMEDVDGYAHSQAPEATPSKTRNQSSSQQQQPEESDFVKWFWEHRGENNRAWKRRRREAAKDKRQRENRRKGLKGRG